jgi:CelD/BcsL family acetyltransferase involved in cellulose biosynthesis
MPARLLISQNFPDFSAFWPRLGSLGEARCHVFQYAEIIQLRIDTVLAARQATPFFVAVLDQDEKPLLLAPFALETRREKSGLIVDARVLSFLDGGLSDYNAPVLFPGVAAWNGRIARSVWGAIAAALPPFDIVEFEKMSDRVGDLSNPLFWLGKFRPGVFGHAVRFSYSWNEMERDLPHRDVWKKARFKKLGKLAIDVARTPQEFDSIIEVLIAQKRRRYIERNGVDGLERPGYLSYLRQSRLLASADGPALLLALKIGDTIVATTLGWVAGRRYNGQFTTFEGGEWRPYSLGQLLMNKGMEWCFHNGVQIFDFGIGDDSYKRKICNVEVPLFYGQIPASFKGRMLVAKREQGRLWRHYSRKAGAIIAKFGQRRPLRSQAKTWEI